MRHLSRLYPILPFLFAGPVFGQSGEFGTRFDVFGPTAYASIGADVAILDDVDGDGVLDLACADQPYAQNSSLGFGWVRVYSGKDGTLIWDIYQDPEVNSFELKVASAGDLNGDGRGDFVVGNPFATAAGGPPNAGVVTAYSGMDASVIWQVSGDATYNWFGQGLANVGDVDGDLVDDLLVAAPNAGSITEGQAYLHSGATGTRFLTVSGTQSYGYMGYTAVEAAGDVNGDGVPDLLLGSDTADDPGSGGWDYGRAHVFSGADGTLLYEYGGAYYYHQLGNFVTGTGDVNNDGFDDFAVGSQDDITIYSGADGT